MAWDLAVSKAFSSIDKILEFGLIKMDEAFKNKYFKKRKDLNAERSKEVHNRDYRLIYDLEEELSLLMEIFEREIEQGRRK